MSLSRGVMSWPVVFGSDISSSNLLVERNTFLRIQIASSVYEYMK